MQKAYGKVLKSLNYDTISGVGIYGYNEGDIAENHYDESRNYFDVIIHGFRKTYNLSKKNKLTKYKNLLSLISTYLVIFFRIKTSSKVHTHFLRIKEEVNNSDIVIWNGRNFRDRKGWGEFYDLLCFVYLPLMVLKYTNKRILFYGVSVWDLKKKQSRWLVSRLLNSDRIDVWVREDDSKEVLSKLGVDSYRCMDLSFVILNEIVDKNKPKKDLRDIKYALTLTDWVEDGLNQRNNYVDVLIGFIEGYGSATNPIYVLPQVYPDWESYKELLLDIRTKITHKDYLVEVEKKLSHEELCSYYFRTETLVTTRMHGAIFGAWCGVKVVSIAYDSGSKWGILRDLNIYNQIIPFKNLTYERLQIGLSEAYNQEIIDKQLIVKKIDNDIVELKHFKANA